MKKNSLTQILLDQVEAASLKVASGKNPTVLSCSGIYLPRKKWQMEPSSYHILNLANEKEPTKVFIKQQPFKNQLHQVLFKESLN